MLSRRASQGELLDPARLTPSDSTNTTQFGHCPPKVISSSLEARVGVMGS